MDPLSRSLLPSSVNINELFELKLNETDLPFESVCKDVDFLFDDNDTTASLTMDLPLKRVADAKEERSIRSECFIQKNMDIDTDKNHPLFGSEQHESPKKIRKLMHYNDVKGISPSSVISVKPNHSNSIKLLSEHERLIELDDKILEQEIEAAVKHFLFPYISNQVDPKNQVVREPFFVTLLTQLNSKYKIKNITKIFNFTLQCYIKCAARGLYTNDHLKSTLRTVVAKPIPLQSRAPKDVKIYFANLQENEQKNLLVDNEYKKLTNRYLKWINQDASELHLKQVKPKQLSKPALVLLNALVPALNIDFPTLNLTSNQICDKVIAILKDVQKEKIEAYKERLIDFEKQELVIKELSRNVPKRSQIYYEMQKDTLKQFLNKAISKLPNEKKVMYLSDLSPEAQEKMLNDSFYQQAANEYQSVCEFFDDEIPVELTTEGYLVLINSVMKLLGRFEDNVLLMEEVLKIADIAFDQELTGL